MLGEKDRAHEGVVQRAAVDLDLTQRGTHLEQMRTPAPGEIVAELKVVLGLVSTRKGERPRQAQSRYDHEADLAVDCRIPQ